MPFLQLLLLAVATMAVLVAVRLLRVRSGREPMPEGRSHVLFLLALVFVPAIAAGIVAQPPGASQITWAIFVGTFLAILAGVAFAMSTIAEFIGEFAHGHLAQILRLALAGTDLDPDDIPSNVALTPRLGEILATVRAADARFPAGPGFPKQPDRPGFRGYWDDLDRATTALEQQMAADNALGLGVAATAQTMADDARSRLTILRRSAGRHGQEWARS